MKILIINVAGIGDFFELIRWLYLVKKQKPYFIVDILVSDRVYDYAKDCPYVRKVYLFKTSKRKVPFSIFNLLTLLEIRKEKYDIILNTFPTYDIVGDIKFLIMFFLIKNKKTTTLGVSRKKRFCIYDKTIFIDKVEYAAIFDIMEIKDEIIYQNILWEKSTFLNNLYFINSSVFLNPFTNSKKRDMPQKLVISLIEEITSLNYKVILSSDQIEKVFSIYSVMSDFAKSRTYFLGKGSIYDLIEIIKKSILVITSDTSTLHIASILNKEVYCFLSDYYDRHEPYNQQKIKYFNIFDIQKGLSIIKKLKEHNE